MSTKRFLILSDGKPGHVNQSIAFCKHLGCEYDIADVRFKSRLLKALSYPADRLGLYARAFFSLDEGRADYAAVVSAGSETYYANRTLAKKFGCSSIAIMLPQGYRLAFDLIVAQQHDNPPLRDNIISLPINLTYVEPRGIVTPATDGKYISFVIGGDSAHGPLDAVLLRTRMRQIFALFPNHRKWLTTSRRTPEKVERMLQEFSFDRAVYYSREAVNPIPDFLLSSEYVFLTADSSSMISEAVSFGSACVEVLPVTEKVAQNRKFSLLIDALAGMDALHLFDGNCAACREKISLTKIFKTHKLQQVIFKTL